MPVAYKPVNGTAVNFGFVTGDGIVIGSLTGTLIQSADVSAEADRYEVANGTGDHVTHSFFDQHKKASIEWVVSADTLANAATATTLTGITPGTIIAITVCDSDPDLVNSYWEIQSGPTTKKTNKDAARISLPLEYRGTIPTVQT